MFTGIIEELGEVVSLKRQGGGAVLTVKAAEVTSGASIGDSIAVSGACLTVTRIDGAALSFDLSAETLKSTVLGSFRPGERVNIEQSLRADGKLGGHFVSGHVDAVGKITGRTREGETMRFRIQAPPEVLALLVEKGSVAVDGISLTVVDVFEDSFTLVIIPHTATVTTLGFKGEGDAVNLEADIIGKYVFRFLQKNEQKSGRLMEALRKGGYM
jgi:riboflavin synthase